MVDREKQWRKTIFKESRKLVFDDKLGFFLKTLLFLLAMISVDVIGIFIGYKINIFLGIFLGAVLWGMIDTIFSKFLLNSNEIGKAARISDSNVHIKAYINSVIWNTITTIIRILPTFTIINTFLFIIAMMFEGWGIKIGALISDMGLKFLIIIGINFIISLFFFSTNFLIIEEKEKNFISAILRSIKLTVRSFKSTFIIVLILNIQVYLIGGIALFGLLANGFEILTTIAFMFVLVALIIYYNVVLIKWYKYVNVKYKKI